MNPINTQSPTLIISPEKLSRINKFTVSTTDGLYKFNGAGLTYAILADDVLVVSQYREVIEEGKAPRVENVVLKTFRSWKDITDAEAEGLVTLETPPEIVSLPAGYGTVFIPHKEDQMPYQRQGYVLLHKDHADVVGNDKVKGTVLTLMLPPDDYPVKDKYRDAYHSMLGALASLIDDPAEQREVTSWLPEWVYEDLVAMKNAKEIDE